VQTLVLAMGDFSDEPFGTSLALQALSTRRRAKVTSARQEPLMWPIAGAPDGSFYSYNQPNLPDQVSARHGHRRCTIKVDPATVQIFQLPAMVNPDVCPKPIPFGGMGEPVNQNGFSDHFPITNQSHRRRLGPRLNVDQAARWSGPHEPHKTPIRAL
jgi:hypothetical protein